MNVRRWFPVPAVAEYLEKLVVQHAQILLRATFAPAQKDSSCEAVEQSVMILTSVQQETEDANRGATISLEHSRVDVIVVIA